MFLFFFSMAALKKNKNKNEAIIAEASAFAERLAAFLSILFFFGGVRAQRGEGVEVGCFKKEVVPISLPVSPAASF